MIGYFETELGYSRAVENLTKNTRTQVEDKLHHTEQRRGWAMQWRTFMPAR